MAPPTIGVIWMTLVILFAAIPIIKGYVDKSMSGEAMGDAAEHRLFANLMKKYNKHIRPIKTHGEITEVFFELSLFDVLELDTKNQVLITNTEIIMKWMDNYMKWDPAEYNGTTVLRIPYRDIWYPDIILQNTAQADYYNTILSTNAIIFSSGEVELVSHGIFESICGVDTQYYPFDQQSCKLMFSSWTYDMKQIVLVPGPADLSKYQANPQFFLENFEVMKHDVHNPCCKNLMSALTYTIQMQRRTVFSLFFFIMPGILINICALMVFSLPAESGEKIGLGINSLLAMIVFLMAMTENLPPTEKLPLAGN
ncbi:neuronal acetylcholine receptor subunit alpha-7-like [Palaemon carinicauda]|uniref:neuronal acetylcholine receptor subunit alpha-7-like n=1 Tax=Palaemon carinicauda TaxID=392227 RepID=UPI0035B613DA